MKMRRVLNGIKNSDPGITGPFVAPTPGSRPGLISRKPSRLLFSSLAAGVAFTVGYALLGNPDRDAGHPILSHAAVIGIPAGAESGESQIVLSSSASERRPTHRESREFSAGEQSREAGCVQVSSIVSPGLTEAPGGMAAAIGAGGGAAPRALVSAGAPTNAEVTPPSALIPLAFRPLARELAAANPQLADALQGLQQDFINAIGGPNQNPEDPAYYQRWTMAQVESDEQLRILLGHEAFLLEQMTVNNQ